MSFDSATICVTDGIIKHFIAAHKNQIPDKILHALFQTNVVYLQCIDTNSNMEVFKYVCEKYTNYIDQCLFFFFYLALVLLMVSIMFSRKNITCTKSSKLIKVHKHLSLTLPRIRARRVQLFRTRTRSRLHSDYSIEIFLVYI